MKTAIGQLILGAACAVFTMNTLAADIPRASADDTRVRVIDYKPLGVTKVFVRRGVVTRIVLEDDEKIEVAVVGLSSECKTTTDEWCVVADPGTNQIFIRPRDAARINNIEVRSSKRDYSLELEVLSEAKVVMNGKQVSDVVPPFFRVVFKYPVAPKVAIAPVVSDEIQQQARESSRGLSPERVAALENLTSVLQRSPTATDAQKMAAIKPPNERLRNEPIDFKNANYSKQVLPQGDDADPTTVFDDGRFTYFEFAGRREIPAIFAHGSDGEPSRVNWHMQPPYIVVQRLARRFTLRLGGAIVGVWNDSFDPVGIDIPTNTISPEVEREIKKEKPPARPLSSSIQPQPSAQQGVEN
jgi:type IV secretion system protein VirB9